MSLFLDAIGLVTKGLDHALPGLPSLTSNLGNTLPGLGGNSGVGLPKLSGSAGSGLPSLSGGGGGLPRLSGGGDDGVLGNAFKSMSSWGPSSLPSMAAAFAQDAQEKFRTFGSQQPKPATAPGATVGAYATTGPFQEAAAQAARAQGLPPDLVQAVLQQESGFQHYNPDGSIKLGPQTRYGQARGIAQFMPDTARGLGINPDNPYEAIAGSAQYLRQLYDQFGGNEQLALAAYNAGPEAVRQAGGVPPFQETQAYLQAIQQHRQTFRQPAAGPAPALAGPQGLNQYEQGLPMDVAEAFCGPTAAMAFLQAFGRTPNAQEALGLAKEVGWNPQQGMAGPQSMVQLLQRYGVQAENGPVDWPRIAQQVQQGIPGIVDSPDHYFQVLGYNPQTGQYNFGPSASIFAGARGQTWFRPEELPGLSTKIDLTPRSAIYAQPPTGYQYQRLPNPLNQPGDLQPIPNAPAPPDAWQQSYDRHLADIPNAPAPEVSPAAPYGLPESMMRRPQSPQEIIPLAMQRGWDALQAAWPWYAGATGFNSPEDLVRLAPGLRNLR